MDCDQNMHTPQDSAQASQTSKRIRMTMACERCRSKKVKCDFVHPQCTRCQTAKSPCSYAGTPSQVDLFSFVRLTDTVEVLQDKVASIETDMRDMQSNTQLIIEELRSKRTYPFDDHKPIHPSNPPPHLPMYRTPSRLTFGGLTSDMDPMQHNWQITLTQRGIRIDTNIASIPDLYDILLKGVNRLSIRSDSPQVPAAKSKHRPNENPDSPISSPPSAPGSPEDIESAVVVRNYPFWKPSTLSFPLYNVWESEADHRTLSQVDAEQIPQETVDRLMDDYVDCILVMQLPDKRGFLAQYYNRTLDPLVSNAILSWTARHSAIYHNRFPGKDPNTVGEHFFQRAKNLLKDRVFESSIVTIHALLMMYLYQVGKMGPTRQETQSEAYLFLGMANRMSLDLKLHQPKPDLDPISQETYRRFFWTGYFLELLASAHMEKPSIVPDRDTITIAGCRPMDHEDDDTRYKVEFIFHRHRIALIYRDITLNLTREEPLLSAVSTLDRKLKAWYHELPAYFRWQMGSTHDFRSASFREQSCLKLMCEYHFCHLQLYRPFLAPPGNTPSTIAILSQDICIKSASAISAILERYTHLKADWCHFTIDAFAMGCLVHQHVVVGVDRRSAEASRLWLVRSVALLKRCPVRHHKAVSSLARSVEEFLVQRGMDPRVMREMEAREDLVEGLERVENDNEDTEDVKTDYRNMFGGSVERCASSTPPPTSSPILFPLPQTPLPAYMSKPAPHQSIQAPLHLQGPLGPHPLTTISSADMSLLPSFTLPTFDVGNQPFSQQAVNDISANTPAYFQFADFLYTPSLDLGIDPVTAAAHDTISINELGSRSGLSAGNSSMSRTSAGPLRHPSVCRNPVPVQPTQEGGMRGFPSGQQDPEGLWTTAGSSGQYYF